MKMNIMLRFILCFCIIVIAFGTGNVMAAPHELTNPIMWQEGGGTSSGGSTGSGGGTSSGGSTSSGGTSSGGSSYISAGPSAGYFFGAAKGSMTLGELLKIGENENRVANMQSAIDEKLSPIKHIQGLIMYVGIISAVSIVAVFAIQWMIATPAKRQELNAGMVPLVLGVALLALGPKFTIMLFNELMIGATASSVGYVGSLGRNIVSIIQTIGYVVAVAMVVIVGIKWITAVPSKRQELKGRMINILIGAVLLIAGVSILGAVYRTAAKQEEIQNSSLNGMIKDNP